MIHRCTVLEVAFQALEIKPMEICKAALKRLERYYRLHWLASRADWQAKQTVNYAYIQPAPDGDVSGDNLPEYVQELCDSHQKNMVPYSASCFTRSC